MAMYRVLQGFILTILTGIIWGGVGIVFSLFAKKNMAFSSFMLMANDGGGLQRIQAEGGVRDLRNRRNSHEPVWNNIDFSLNKEQIKWVSVSDW